MDKRVSLLDFILKTVAEVSEQSEDRLKARTKKKEVVIARHLYRYFSRKYTRYSLAAIGEITGNDHATTLHGIKETKQIVAAKEHPYYSWYITIDGRLQKEISITSDFLLNAVGFVNSLDEIKEQVPFYETLVKEFTDLLIHAKAVELLKTNKNLNLD